MANVLIRGLSEAAVEQIDAEAAALGLSTDGGDPSTVRSGGQRRLSDPTARGFRNILVHQSFGDDVDVVLDVVKIHLPPLAEAPRGHLTAH